MVRLRDYTPRGYNARHILILIVPMLVFVIAMTLFFFNNHVQEVNRKLSTAVAQEINFLVARHDAGDADWERIAASLSNAGLMQASFAPGVTQISTPPGRFCCQELNSQLHVQIKHPFAYAYQPGDMVEVRVLLNDGVLVSRFDRKRVMIITAHVFIVWSVLFSLLLLATSYAFLRNQVRSMLQLAKAADAFGRGEDAPSFRPSGAREVRQAAWSLIRMRNRIKRFIDQRTAMLAGVSHDLRTPLARLKLELALLPKGTDLGAAKADITEMERMLDGYLAFARGEDGEATEQIDLVALAREATSHAAGRSTLDLVAPSELKMRLRPLAMKRAIANLANNAADHGKKIAVKIAAESQGAVVSVEDDGPGIPADQYEDAFKPFSRLDPSRNQNVSGVGLGLTISRDIVRAHGGDLTLGKSEMGGLRATIRLPFEAGRLAEADAA